MLRPTDIGRKGRARNGLEWEVVEYRSASLYYRWWVKYSDGAWRSVTHSGRVWNSDGNAPYDLILESEAEVSEPKTYSVVVERKEVRRDVAEVVDDRRISLTFPDGHTKPLFLDNPPEYAAHFLTAWLQSWLDRK